MKTIFKLLLSMFVVLTLVGGPFTVWADEAAYLYNRGNKLYRQEDFAGAIEAYTQALLKGEHPALYYNLGNAYYRLGDLGRARLNYERALKLSPRDRDVKQNLSYLKQHMKDKEISVAENFLENILRRMVGFMSLNEWVTLTLAFYLLAMASLFFIILKPGSVMRPAAQAALIAAIVILLVTLPFAASRYYRDEVTVKAVAIADRVEARSAPGEEYDPVFTFHAGMEMSIRQTRQGWHLISLPNGISGWVKDIDLGII